MPPNAMDDIDDLTGRLWSEAQEMLRARGFEGARVRVLDITPERAPRTPTQSFGWGEKRVVRARLEGEAALITVAREMRL